MFDLNLIADITGQVISPYGMLLILSGVTAGILGGALPGISPTMTVALLSTATYGMETVFAFLFLSSIQVGATYGGSISATILNIPGTASSAPTALEGYPLAMRGKAQLALSVNVISSFIGNSIGVVLMVLIMPAMLFLALRLGTLELFWVSIFGIIICVQLSRRDFYKGLLAGCLGLMVSCVGMDSLTGIIRLTMGIPALRSGIPMIPAMVGLFGMAEVFTSLGNLNAKMAAVDKDKLFQFGLWFKHAWMGTKAAVLGFLIGVVPGVGSNIACWVGYDQAYRSSKNKEMFGKGCVEGLIGSETGNNACVPGAYPPLLALGIPGDSNTAVMLGVMTIHGVQIGPSFLAKNPQYVWFLAIGMFLAGLAFLFIGSYLAKLIIKVLLVPLPTLMACVAVLCAIGAYTATAQTEQIFIMFTFGIIGLVMKKLGFPIAPMVLGVILGGDYSDKYFRRSLAVSRGSFEPFFTRPLCIVFIVVIIYMLYSGFVAPVLKARRQAKQSGSSND